MRTCIAATVAVCLAVPSWADARLTVLLDVMRLDDVVRILRLEGAEYANTLNEDMLDGQGGAFFDTQVDRIYDARAMAEHIRSGFEEILTPDEIEAVIGFFNSDLGAQIISLENAAREAMTDPDVEEAARAAYIDAQDAPGERLALLDRFVEENSLMDRNVAAAMSSNLAFYNGLVDGKYISLSPDQMLTEVWDQEEELRADTQDWLYGYFLLAYQPLKVSELEAYVAFSVSPVGQSLNRALFAGHEQMYREISYALGRAIALSAAGSTL